MSDSDDEKVKGERPAAPPVKDMTAEEWLKNRAETIMNKDMTHGTIIIMTLPSGSTSVAWESNNMKDARKVVVMLAQAIMAEGI